MAGSAGFRRVNVPFLHKFFTHFNLGGGAFGFPVEVVHFLLGTDVALRVAVTFQTPTHALGLVVPDDVHFVHLAMATGTTDATVHVGGMVEVNVIRGLVDPDPRDWSPVFPTFHHRDQFGAVGFDGTMASHAGLGRGNIRMGRDFHGRVAIPAIHPELVDVDRVGKFHRLFRLVTDPGVFGREIIGYTDHGGHADAGQCHDQFDREPVRPLGK